MVFVSIALLFANTKTHLLSNSFVVNSLLFYLWTAHHKFHA